MISYLVEFIKNFWSSFPHEAIPDGSVWWPHHYLYSSFAAMLIAFRHWDDKPEVEPMGVVGGIATSLFGWFFLWGMQRPRWGAVLTMVGLLIATVSAIGRKQWREDHPTTSRVAILGGLGLAWDDVINHAFGVATPGDSAWKSYLHEHIGLSIGLVLAGLGAYFFARTKYRN